MTRFSFPLADGREIKAPEAEECVTLDNVRKLAMQSARDLAADRRPGELNGLFIRVTDEDGNEVLKIPLRESQ
jgi:hypothetical protein